MPSNNVLASDGSSFEIEWYEPENSLSKINQTEKKFGSASANHLLICLVVLENKKIICFCTHIFENAR